ncbi:M1 family metallopeptidase [Thermohalobacter berrensis]|uniref:M1 family metallopeptidase n=1 Tax=Thermohalobacter berrensis TaxID=99594 RepID=UPI000E73E3C6|nr:M1 family metallopeptidase [Thermohalobacter berrensis]
MYYILKRLFKKVLSLLIITVLPIIIYLYIPEDIKYTFNLDRVNQINKYNIVADFNPQNKEIEINTKITFVNIADKPLDKIFLHLYPNTFSSKDKVPYYNHEMEEAYPKGFNPGYVKVKEVKVNNSSANFKIIGKNQSILMIKLKKPIKRNNKRIIDIKCNVKIPNSRGRFGYGNFTYNITNWYPIVAVYDNEGWNLDPYHKVGDPFYSNISNYEVEFITPKEYFPVTTGKIVKKKDKGTKIHYFIKANMVRDFAVIVSDKFKCKEAIVEGIKVRSYYFNEKYRDEALEYAVNSLKIFNKLFGKYPYDEYKVVASDFFVGGMEYPNLVMIDNEIYNYQSPDILEYIIVHETAHQWWYGVVGNDEVDEPWLDESITEYSTILYYEEKYGKTAADCIYNIMIKDQYKQYAKGKNLEEIINKKIDEFTTSREYTALVYHRGAMALEELRENIGDEKFFKILRRYYEDYKFKNATTVDFIKTCKTVLTEKDEESIKEILCLQ